MSDWFEGATWKFGRLIPMNQVRRGPRPFIVLDTEEINRVPARPRWLTVTAFFRTIALLDAAHWSDGVARHSKSR